MPGSIQVSVLGLMDLSSPPPLSSLSLTVAMGKREYQTVGVGELSLPVVSLRENLIVMVHDEEGEEILRTEFKTMLLLERGLWDNLFPLKNGGSLHMKLQFLLSEEDRKRIREMRNSALQRRHLEKPGIRHRRSFSDDRIGCSPTRTIAEIGTEEMLLDHSESADLIVGPYFGGKFLASRIGMVGFPRSAVIREEVSNLNFPQNMSKSFSVGMLSEIRLHGKSKPVKEPFLLKETQNAIPAMHYEILENKDLICDEEIHMLDIGTQEIRVTKNTSSDAEPPYSAECGNYMTFDNGHKTIGSGKSTSLGAGTSSERKDLISVNVDKVPSIIGIIRNFETVREKENINFMRRGGAGIGSNAASGTFKARPLPQSSVELGPAGAQHSRAGKRHNTTDMAGDGNATSSKVVNRKINIVDADKNNNEDRNLRDKSLPLNKIFDDLGEIEHACQQGSLGEVARTVSDENMQSPSNEQISSAEHGAAAKQHKSRNWPDHGDATSFKGVNRKTETVDINENGDEEQNLGVKYLPLKKMVDETKNIKHPYHQETSVEVAKTVNDENTLQNPSNELADLGSSYEKAEASKSGYSSLCPIGILGTWTPRHICITTGSKLLREFAESCTISFETNPIESSSMREADTKVCSSFS
ncbi:hypothetical protein IEQ34_011022 [Dendrobium chrysotoxum]|uniref:Uncharacterized protein n=1 Tax=Dendrobium chrysotoxum TaxID=161865 RepID=A0AAV7GX38_DENCH|nr:hypothetical protein IEQ34_011022 [Dendrobium chrysotoxum]